MRKMLIFLLSLLLLLTACSARSSQTQEQQTQNFGNPTAEEILKSNPDADLLQLRNIVYIKAEDNSWVQQENLGSLQEVGEVQSIYDGNRPFENEMSTKLAPGTKIYEPTQHGLIIVAVNNGIEIRYIGLVEG
ncbi:hypothetical protein SAMN05661091_5771 [Paenibacillus uliginis N3/975]|uniref:Lipoprotein n=1 Tax=Paenibacillus uliginis N3/975 TaxID=1313296 RepID=A0A1X7HTR7_9BACL|nr:hypothetical protein [Paenibacillus uliginis]SMF92321.1 hypothetical protein SAMN05661091_5771 [Paenibacillus uliginis N3/975]